MAVLLVVSGCATTPAAVLPTVVHAPALTRELPTETWTVAPMPTNVPPTATSAPPTAIPTESVVVMTATATPVVNATTEVAATEQVSPTVQAENTVESTAEAANSNPCLSCHSFQELLVMEPRYDYGEGQVNPHWYVPHDSTAIPDCTTCHTPHSTAPLPKGPEDVDLSRVNVDYCYSCHHLQNFTPCAVCHE